MLEETVRGAVWGRRILLAAMSAAGATDSLPDAAPDEQVRRRILVENPAALYDFS
jgi:predicted TIM-barrel fold metal-dependent hydrolase